MTLHEASWGPVLDALPYGVVLVGPEQAVTDANPAARRFLPRMDAGGAPPRCRELLHCDRPDQPCVHGCLAARAAQSGEALPEVRIDVPGEAPHSALWVTAAPLGSPPGGAILHLRPGNASDRRRRSEPHWLTGPKLHIQALGRTVVRSGAASLDGQWIGERAGQVLKYLVCQRDRGASADAIADAIWPHRGPEALNSTRHAIHRLRSMLEPDGRAHGSSAFVIAIPGGYALDGRRIELDTDAFERSASDGMAAMRALEFADANRLLKHAADLYKGEFLADEPYADWAYAERSRLHGLAVRSLRALAVLARERDDHGAALLHLEHLCALEPYDDGAHHELIAALYAAGRLGDVKRSYAAFARRMRQEFDAAPSFDLKSLPTRDARA
jgi:DNA-binding SARP family transcriptional activator